MTETPQDQPPKGGQQPYSGQPTPPPPPPPQAPTYGQPTYGQQGYGPLAQAQVSPSDARMWSLFAHLGGIFFYFVPSLVIYLIYKDRDPFVRRHSVQALNFQIMALIGYAISGVLSVVLIGYVTGFAIFVAVVIFSVLASIAANKGEDYTYPLVPQLVS